MSSVSCRSIMRGESYLRPCDNKPAGKGDGEHPAEPVAEIECHPEVLFQSVEVFIAPLAELVRVRGHDVDGGEDDVRGDKHRDGGGKPSRAPPANSGQEREKEHDVVRQLIERDARRRERGAADFDLPRHGGDLPVREGADRGGNRPAIERRSVPPQEDSGGKSGGEPQRITQHERAWPDGSRRGSSRRPGRTSPIATPRDGTYRTMPAGGSRR